MNKKSLFFFLTLFLLNNCSFVPATGIWTGENEEKRIGKLEKEQVKERNREKIYSISSDYVFEKNLSKKINLLKPNQNLSWKMPGFNQQNHLSNLYLPETSNRFLKKKVGKNKFSLSKNTSSPLVYESNIFLSDNRGTIFNINSFGELNRKMNIYTKIYKRIYKNLTISVFENNIYIADNIGFIYAISIDTGKLVWIKNHGVPFKSKIKIFDNKIFLMNQDNKIISFSTIDGSVLWTIPSVSSFIKTQNFLSLAVSKQGDVVVITSLGDLLKINSENGNIKWSLNTLGSTLPDITDFFKSSDIVITDKSVFFSAQSSFFSCDLNSGYINWRLEVSSVGTPIVDKNNIFIVTENGFFVILDKNNGQIISSVNILKILKLKKQNTKVAGFIMGSEKIYSVTTNGYLIISSAISGKVENFVKIGDPVTSAPIITDGKLFIYTQNSRILGFN